MPTFKIDGKDVPFEPGDSILRAAHRAGIDIPYYCWHPGLSVAANCRMCLVEILPPPGRTTLQLDVLRLAEDGQSYEVERKPKLQPACQVPVAEGMEVLSDTSPHVLRARHAVQEFLLLNHPVDCPICDQAGECKLQDYWLEHQHSKKRMLDPIQHKPKAVVFGPTIVYDAERCIVCTRCVRFCAEVAKDPVLSVRERGNLNEIVVAPGRQLDHRYTLMTEHVCPVGALTSSDFRFKARVWFLRSAKAVCQGCATGCNAWLDFDPRNQTIYRYRPRFNDQVNQDWMCDDGMLSYKWAHQGRVIEPTINGTPAKLEAALHHAAELLKQVPAASLGVVLSARHSNEDNFALAKLATGSLGASQLFLTAKPNWQGDDVLRSDDQNPNRAGATQAAGTTPLRSFDELLSAIESGQITHVLALGDEVPSQVEAARATLRKLKALVAISIWQGPIPQEAQVVLPARSWAETTGTYTNRKGLTQRSEKAVVAKGEALPGWQLVARLAQAMGYPMQWNRLKDVQAAMQPQAEAQG